MRGKALKKSRTLCGKNQQQQNQKNQKNQTKNQQNQQKKQKKSEKSNKKSKKSNQKSTIKKTLVRLFSECFTPRFGRYHNL